ncbi:MAG: hypothetical protein QNJ16_14385 [Rhodobacter sp.]|nr:hypothetical protein [Rhodobacter sp.]
MPELVRAPGSSVHHLAGDAGIAFAAPIGCGASPLYSGGMSGSGGQAGLLRARDVPADGTLGADRFVPPPL